MSFFKKQKYDADTELFQAIEECKKVAAFSAKEAKDNVKFIKESISQANITVQNCIKDISSQKIKDPEILNSLTDQLVNIKTTFCNEYDEVEKLVEKKIKEANKFNITLFGRTKVGKSTLMEILTNGNGNSIGKGGQRTTLNIRQYNWKGLTITDIPGIDAFQGESDDRLAFEAAKSADIVVFMISDGQPEATEAKWLVRLKREDKPIVCLCNAKRTLDDELDMELFLDNPSEILNDERIQEIIAQFNAFVKELLPNEHIDILVTQLQARFLANKKENSAKRQALIYASRFRRVEHEIQNLVIKDGISFRRKCFLSIIDSPLYSQSLELFKCSTDAYLKYMVADEKMQEFCNWQKDFVIEERTQLLNRIDQIFEKVIAMVSYFVEDNLERENFKNLWDEYLKSEDLSGKVQRCYLDSVSKAKKKVDQLFLSLDKEIELSMKLLKSITSDAGGERITNWKRIWNWAAAGAGAVSSVCGMVSVGAFGVAAAAAAIPVVGWVCAGAALLFGVFAWFSDSRENKLKNARQKQEKALTTCLKESKRKTKNNVYQAFQSDVVSGLLSDSYNRFHIIETTLLTLANSQRELGLKYLKHHADISKRIVQSAFFDIGVDRLVLDHIDFVARIPGKKTIIGCSDENLGKISYKISEKIGNKEEVRIFRKSLYGSLENRLKILCNYFHIFVPMKVRAINKEGFSQNVVFMPQSSQLDEEGEINLLLLQQILNIHIIKR